MDILDCLTEHDARATRGLLETCRDLSDEQWNTLFPVGQGSLYKTFDHMVDSMEYWVSLMQGQPGPFVPAVQVQTGCWNSIVQRFEVVSPVFLAVARQLRDDNRLSERFVDIETGPARRTFRACIVHVATHSMHHRAQIPILLDLLAVEYNPFAGSALDAYPLEEGIGL